MKSYLRTKVEQQLNVSSLDDIHESLLDEALQRFETLNEMVMYVSTRGTHTKSTKELLSYFH